MLVLMYRLLEKLSMLPYTTAIREARITDFSVSLGFWCFIRNVVYHFEVEEKKYA